MTKIAADGAPYKNPQPPPDGPRRQKLHHRVKAQAANATAAMGGAHPYGTADTPMVLPLVLVTTGTSQDGTEVTSGMQDMVPLVTADGAVIAGTGPGRWDQLMQAGRI